MQVSPTESAPTRSLPFGLPQLFLNPWRGMNAEFAQIRGERPKWKPDHVEAV